MKLFNLAFKNIKKSIKDYSIYFLTLVIAVAIFYIFNSIDSQTAMMSLNKLKMDMIESLVDILSYLSVFVSVVLGFLIVYADNFLIKRRKKEIGIYFGNVSSKSFIDLSFRNNDRWNCFVDNWIDLRRRFITADLNIYC